MSSCKYRVMDSCKCTDNNMSICTKGEDCEYFQPKEEPPITFSLPANATNGDVLKALFPNIEVSDIGGKLYWVLLERVARNDFDLDVSKKWWDELYKKE